MLKRLLISAVVLIAPAIQPMDAPIRHYSRLPEEIKMEIMVHIVNSHDLLQLKKFAESNKENNNLVRKYLAQNADEIIHQALTSFDTRKAVAFLAALKCFDAQMGKKIGKYISDENFDSLKSISLHAECYIPDVIEKTRNYELAKIMLSSDYLSRKCLSQSAQEVVFNSGKFIYPPLVDENKTIEMLEFILNRASTVEGPVTEQYKLGLLPFAINERVPLSIISFLIKHPQLNINEIDTSSGWPETSLDVAHKIPEFDNLIVGAVDADAGLARLRNYRRAIIDLLEANGAKTYDELRAE